jgi:hypothetical protein
MELARASELPLLPPHWETHTPCTSGTCAPTANGKATMANKAAHKLIRGCMFPHVVQGIRGQIECDLRRELPRLSCSSGSGNKQNDARGRTKGNVGNWSVVDVYIAIALTTQGIGSPLGRLSANWKLSRNGLPGDLLEGDFGTTSRLAGRKPR